MTNRKLNILLVEDNISDVELMEIALGRGAAFPFEMHVCEDGEQAIEYLNGEEKKRPDLIILDLNLPKKSGHEVLKEIKTSRNLASIPVIVLTTTAQSREVMSVKAYPSTQFLTKPFRFDGYKDVILAIEKFAQPSAARPE